MTAFWDDKTSQVTQASTHYETDDAFLAQVGDIEKEVVHIVSLTTGDREFPNDLRERIQACIANRCCYQVGDLPANEKAVEYLLSVRSSMLIEDLHSLFHEVAQRKPKHRYGYFSDDPSGFLRIRDEEEAEAPEQEKKEKEAAAWVRFDVLAFRIHAEEQFENPHCDDCKTLAAMLLLSTAALLKKEV